MKTYAELFDRYDPETESSDEMLDILFIFLFTLVVTLIIAVTHYSEFPSEVKEINLPGLASEGKDIEVLKNSAVVIKREGKEWILQFDGKDVLPKDLKTRIAEAGGPVIQIIGDTEADYGRVLEIIKICQESGKTIELLYQKETIE